MAQRQEKEAADMGTAETESITTYTGLVIGPDGTEFSTVVFRARNAVERDEILDCELSGWHDYGKAPSDVQPISEWPEWAGEPPRPIRQLVGVGRYSSGEVVV